MSGSKLTKKEAETVAEQAAEGDIFKNPAAVLSDDGWEVRAKFEMAGFKGDVTINEFDGGDIAGD